MPLDQVYELFGLEGGEKVSFHTLYYEIGRFVFLQMQEKLHLNLVILNRSNIYSSYENVAVAGFVVFVDTTLGYEALARGKKTAAFTLRGKSIGSDACNFGWPADFPDNGPFWTNHADEREFERVMDYITTVSDEEWKQTRQRYVPDLMEYDPGNTRFLKLMREIGVPLKSEYEKDV
jgi:surface carbohydrate biosynthesis protein